MREHRDRSAERALGLAMLAMFGVLAMRSTLLAGWQDLTGAVVPNVIVDRSHTGMPIELLSVGGDRRVGWNERAPASAFHMIVVHPTPSAQPIGKLSTGSRFAYSLDYEWRAPGAPAYVQRLDARYDALLQTIRIGDRRFFLPRGNLFVVRFGDDGAPRVTQLRATMRDQAGNSFEQGRRLEDAFLRATRGDPEVQRLLRALRGGSFPTRRCGWRAGAVERAAPWKPVEKGGWSS